MIDTRKMQQPFGTLRDPAGVPSGMPRQGFTSHPFEPIGFLEVGPGQTKSDVDLNTYMVQGRYFTCMTNVPGVTVTVSGAGGYTTLVSQQLGFTLPVRGNFATFINLSAQTAFITFYK